MFFYELLCLILFARASVTVGYVYNICTHDYTYTIHIVSVMQCNASWQDDWSLAPGFSFVRNEEDDCIAFRFFYSSLQDTLRI